MLGRQDFVILVEHPDYFAWKGRGGPFKEEFSGVTVGHPQDADA